MSKRVRRTRRGTLRLHLPSEERLLLQSLPSQVLELLETADPVAHRIFPPAYEQQPELETEYRDLMHDELLEQHRRALSTLEQTANADELNEEEAGAWLGALNDMRLVLGTRLDVTEEMEPLPDDHPDAPVMAIYTYLSYLEEQVVEALGP